jgi:nicotinic acid phosphoribosyltransferase, putative
LPHDVDPKFFHYLLSLSAKDVELYSVPEGSVVFPKVPLIIVQAPLPVAQLLETILLNLVNFAR